MLAGLRRPIEMALPTQPDIDRHPELEMSATKPEVEITFERKEMETQFQRVQPHFVTMPDSDM